MKRTIVLVVLALGAGLFSSSIARPSSSLADSITQGGGGEVELACAAWTATDGTGYTVDICAEELNEVSYYSYPAPAPIAPEWLVVWWNNCGTVVGCMPYYNQASMLPTDLIIGPLVTTATFSDNVNGCQLSFDITATPSSPTDGAFSSPTGSLWPSQPTVDVGASAGREEFGAGSGTICKEVLTNGPAQGLIYRATGASVQSQNFGPPQFPGFQVPFDIHGTVTNDDGQPIPDAFVSDGNVTVQTASNGTYELRDNLVSVATDVYAWAQSYGFDNKDVTIVDQQQPVNFVLPPGS